MIFACRPQDIPTGEGRAITLGGRRVAIFNAEAGWFALDALCPHRGGPLADGILAERSVTCPLHERRFDLATGEGQGVPDCVAAHRVRVQDDAVYIAFAS
jgi:nitrite reductase (NADH) small subunit